MILSLLSEIKCPYVLEEEGNGIAGIDFGGSRSLLLVAGWLMGVTDFFEKIRTKLIEKLYEDLYIKPKVSNNGTGKQKAKSNKRHQAENHSENI